MSRRRRRDSETATGPGRGGGREAPGRAAAAPLRRQPRVEPDRVDHARGQAGRADRPARAGQRADRGGRARPAGGQSAARRRAEGRSEPGQLPGPPGGHARPPRVRRLDRGSGRGPGAARRPARPGPGALRGRDHHRRHPENPDDGTPEIPKVDAVGISQAYDYRQRDRSTGHTTSYSGSVEAKDANSGGASLSGGVGTDRSRQHTAGSGEQNTTVDRTGHFDWPRSSGSWSSPPRSSGCATPVRRRWRACGGSSTGPTRPTSPPRRSPGSCAPT